MLSLFFRVFEKDSDSLGFEPRLLFLLSFRFSGNKDSSGGKRIFVVFSISSIYPFLGFKKTKGINNPLLGINSLGLPHVGNLLINFGKHDSKVHGVTLSVFFGCGPVLVAEDVCEIALARKAKEQGYFHNWEIAMGQ